MVDDPCIRQGIKGNRVAVTAAFRLRYRLGRDGIERLLQMTPSKQVTGGPRTRRMRVAPYVVLPGGNVAGRIERGFRARHHRGSERLPRMLLVAHPLNAHRAAWNGSREQGGIRRDVVGPVVPVTTGAFHVDAVHLFIGQMQDLRDCRAQRVHALAVRPYGERVLVEDGNCAGGSDRAV